MCLHALSFYTQSYLKQNSLVYVLIVLSHLFPRIKNSFAAFLPATPISARSSFPDCHNLSFARQYFSCHCSMSACNIILALNCIVLSFYTQSHLEQNSRVHVVIVLFHLFPRIKNSCTAFLPATPTYARSSFPDCHNLSFARQYFSCHCSMSACNGNYFHTDAFITVALFFMPHN